MSGPIPSRNDIVGTAKKYLGVPFVHQGRTEKGLDCLGLVVRVAYDLDVMHLCIADAENQYDHRFNTYSRHPGGNFFRRMLGQILTQVPIEEAKKGDVLFMTGDNWVHVGIKSGPDTMIHAYALKPGKVCEHRIDASWGGRLKCAFSWPFYHGDGPCLDLELVNP